VELDARRTAGSAVHCDIVVSDRAVSRIHFELDPRPDGLWVRDLASRNGTVVNGMRIGEARVPSGSVIRVGTTDMTATYAEAEGPPAAEARSFGSLETASPAMASVFAELAALAKNGRALLLEGEAGTGKKRLARAIHDASPRTAGPFVVVECAALPDESRIAETMEEALSSAEGGTLVLDAPEELPAAVQRELMPPLEAKAFRLITTTQRDLRRLVNQGAFRENLYFELAGVTVRVPALRERPEDLDALLDGFLEGARIDDTSIADLEQLPWTGNLHELRRYAERLRAGGTPSDSVGFATLHARRLDDDGTAEMPTFPALAASEANAISLSLGGLLPSVLEPWFSIGFKEFRERWIELGEREYLVRLMQKTNRSSGAASRQAGLERTYLYRLIKKHRV
jgi:DNA-binding NtrC family response regulator